MNSLQIDQSIAHALKYKEAVVALESTVITHGLPYPENLQLALDMESTIKDLDAAPATISVVRGKINIGTSRDDLEFLSQAEDLKKISIRDFGPAVAKGSSGGTTVAGSMFAAHQAGINVMATGGIGGVHRRSAHDISTDLIQLSRTPMILVCAGAKSILDLPATLEKLETLGIPVIGYKTDEFPAFYSQHSGLPVSASADSIMEIAKIAKAHWKLGLMSTILVVTPPPDDVAMDHLVVEAVIDEALDDLEENNIKGQDVTPYLLNVVKEKTLGQSLKANLGLLKNNASVAAKIAKDLAGSGKLSA